jgi:hypothetical protein
MTIKSIALYGATAEGGGGGVPDPHKTSHATGGTDALSPADIGAATAEQGELAASALQPGDADNPFVLAGVATDGSGYTLTDTSQDWATEQWTGHFLVLEHDGAQTRHTVLGSEGDTLGFAPPIGIDTEATATIGSGVDPEGQITVTLVGKGADGNNWELHLISEAAGVLGSMTNVFGADVENKIITVFIDTNGLGEQQQLYAGNLALMFSQNLPSHISAPSEGFTSGRVPLGTEAEPVVITFSGGIDAESVEAGDRYWLLGVKFATTAQGDLADTAIQPGDIGTAAAEDIGYFATAAQGAKADASAILIAPLSAAAYGAR